MKAIAVENSDPDLNFLLRSPIRGGAGSRESAPTIDEGVYIPRSRQIMYDPPPSVADPDPGSSAFLTPGSGIRNRFFPDLRSRIPNPYF